MVSTRMGASTGYLPESVYGGLAQQRYVKSHRKVPPTPSHLPCDLSWLPASSPTGGSSCRRLFRQHVFPGPGEKPTPKRSGTVAPSPKLGADSRCIASVSVSPIHKHFGCRIEDTQTHPASGRSPGIFDKPLQWKTATEIRAKFSETSGEAPLTLQLVVC